MKAEKKLPNTGKKQNQREHTKDPVRSFLMITLCAFAAVVLCAGSLLDSSDAFRVYAAGESAGDETDGLPYGISGVVTGVRDSMYGERSVAWIGTSCEQVMVGQRVKKVDDRVTEFNLSHSMESRVNDFDARTLQLASQPTLMSDTDYDTLLHIVEAEAGTEDVKGRVLVANVIMNRVKHEEFPDNITDVVWQYIDGVPQFSPIYDGRIGEVTVTDETREAVKQALEGVDYSEGALFFIQKSAAEAHNVSWFEKDLKKLFKYGVHEFYTYPDEAGEAASGDVVQMVKNDVE